MQIVFDSNFTRDDYSRQLSLVLASTCQQGGIGFIKFPNTDFMAANTEMNRKSNAPASSS